VIFLHILHIFLWCLKVFFCVGFNFVLLFNIFDLNFFLSIGPFNILCYQFCPKNHILAKKLKFGQKIEFWPNAFPTGEAFGIFCTFPIILFLTFAFNFGFCTHFWAWNRTRVL